MSNDKAHQPAVGLVGLGDQGPPIAHAIAESRFTLHVWARRPESLKALDGYPHTAERGLTELRTASDRHRPGQPGNRPARRGTT